VNLPGPQPPLLRAGLFCAVSAADCVGHPLCVIMDFVMALAKRVRSVRHKKKSAPTAAKKSSHKSRFLSLGARKRARSHKARLSPKVVEDRLIREYHELVDKKLQGLATPSELAALEKTKSKMHAMEDEQTSLFEVALEQRHNTLMEKLSSLTDELRGFTAAAKQ
jgi:hypothetical protein